MNSLLPRSGANVAGLVAVFVIVVLVAVAQTDLRSAGEPKVLASWSLTGSDEANLEGAAGGLRFFPQSMTLVDDAVVITNRHEPALVRVPLAGGPPKVVRLSHAADRKFDARFFIDLIADGKSLLLLEQSTFTVRRAGDDGKISEFFLTTEAEGAIITQLWPVAGSKVALYDEGRRCLLVRDLAHPAINEKPDSTGFTVAVGSGPAVVGGRRALYIDRQPSGRQVAMSVELEPGARARPVFTSERGSLSPLAVGPDGVAWLYLRESAADGRAGSVIVAVEPGSKSPARRLAVPPLVFHPQITRPVLAAGGGRLLMLVGESDQLRLVEFTLPTR